MGSMNLGDRAVAANALFDAEFLKLLFDGLPLDIFPSELQFEVD